jgi:hypothetical protein
MLLIHRFLFRLLALAKRDRFDAELSAELRHHVECATDELLERGVRPGEARRIALRDVGGIEQVRAEYRDQLGFPTADSVVQNLTLAGRSLLKHPLSTAVIVLSLTVGIGGSTAIVALLNAVLFHLPPLYRAPQEFVLLQQNPPDRPGIRSDVSGDLYMALRAELSERTQGLAAVRAQSTASVRITDYPIGLDTQAVSPDVFDLLGVSSSPGRNFVSDEYREGAAGVVVLSHEAWREYFEGDLDAGEDDVIGRVIGIKGEPHTIVGIIPERFWLGSTGTDLWLPLKLRDALDPTRRDLSSERPTT